MTSKEFFLDKVLQQFPSGKTVKILEVGCGTASYLPTILQVYPGFSYVGVEPIAASYKAALENTKDMPQVKIVHQLAYDGVEGLKENDFDLVISFSVLEHVKDLQSFMKLCGKYCKKDGLMVHRYDLGHALYPGSYKERFHVWLGNTIPKVLPERKFVRYVPLVEVESLYEKYGFHVQKRTHHQMRSHKRLEKVMSSPEAGKIMEEIYAWEMVHSVDFDRLSERQREKLFPTIAVWGMKS